MTLQQLKYVLTIAEEGSFSAAARKLYLAQPSLSAMVRNLEEELGITIFDRSTRALRVTEEGMRLISYANQMVDTEEQLRESFGTRTKQLRFQVSSQHYTFVCEAFRRLIERTDDPNYSMGINLTRTQEIIDDVATLKSDIGVMYVSPHGGGFTERNLAKENIQFHSLRTFPVCAFMHQDHPLAKKDSVTLADLAGYPAIVYEQKESHHSFSEEIPVARTTPPKQIVVTDLYASEAAMDSCLAYDIGTGYITEEEKQKTKHVAIPVRGAGNLTVGWIGRDNGRLSAVAEQFLAFLKEEIRKE